jgi:hypothetical protein
MQVNKNSKTVFDSGEPLGKWLSKNALKSFVMPKFSEVKKP